MKVRIDSDEWYPVYSVFEGDKYGYEVEVDEATLERWKRAEEAFRAAQDEMGDLHAAAQKIALEQAAKERAEREAAVKAERARLEKERQQQVKARQKAEKALRNRLDAAGGQVFDAQGRPIGTVGPDGKVRP